MSAAGRRGLNPARYGSHAPNTDQPSPRADYNDQMPDADDAREPLDVRIRQPPRPVPIVLSARYLRDVARVEALPENRDGADKTWVLRFAAEMVRLQRNVVRTR